MNPSIAPIGVTNTPPSSTETLHDAFLAATKREASLDISRIESRYSVGSAEDEKQEPTNHQLSTLRLLIAHVGAALTLFLATTDSNIVSTSLPTISRELNASQTQYTWVGVAYLLTQTAFQPLYGRFSDLVGRKVLLFSSITVFALGSLLCGASKSITMLIASRAMAGVGGGGIVSSVWVITSEIVPIQSRANWSQALSITWSCSAIAGPLLGGAFSGNEDSGLSWRWGFYINLPICFLASVVLSFSLRGVSLQRSTKASWRTILERFDFGGLFLFMAGTTSIIFGFSFANENGWKSATTITSLSLGSVTLISAGLYESWTKRDCLFPPSAFTNSTAVIVLVIVFFHNFTFNAAMFYLALFFQTVKGYTPLEAGMQLLPFSLGSSLASIPAAWFIGYWQRCKNDSSGQNIIISTGLLMSAIGFGLFALLDAAASRAEQVIFILIAGVGMGLLFHAPYQVFVRTLKPDELATGTSAFFLVRFTGATVGLAVAGAILYARAFKLLPSDLGVDITAKVLEDITLIEPLEARQKALDALSTSIQTIWIVCAPSLGLSFLISLLTKKLPFDTDVKEGALEKIETDSKSATV